MTARRPAPRRPDARRRPLARRGSGGCRRTRRSGGAWIRDYVDGRLRMLEFLMPIVVVAWFTLILRSASIYIYASFAMELVVVVGIILGIWLNLRVKREVRARFGEEHVRGSGFYAFSRAAMPRFLRQPRPTVTFTGKAK